MQKFYNNKNEFSPAQEKEWIKEVNIIYAGLIGIGLVMIQPFLNGDGPIDLAAMICVISFGISTPILAALLLLNRHENFMKHISHSVIVAICKAIAQLAAVTGFVAGLWHVSPLAGQVAVASCIVGVFAYSAGYVIKK